MNEVMIYGQIVDGAGGWAMRMRLGLVVSVSNGSEPVFGGLVNLPWEYFHHIIKLRGKHLLSR